MLIWGENFKKVSLHMHTHTQILPDICKQKLDWDKNKKAGVKKKHRKGEMKKSDEG